jgi:hypothetical protein
MGANVEKPTFPDLANGQEQLLEHTSRLPEAGEDGARGSPHGGKGNDPRVAQFSGSDPDPRQ